jgi:hypothetical protein
MMGSLGDRPCTPSDMRGQINVATRRVSCMGIFLFAMRWVALDEMTIATAPTQMPGPLLTREEQREVACMV